MGNIGRAGPSRARSNSSGMNNLDIFHTPLTSLNDLSGFHEDGPSHAATTSNIHKQQASDEAGTSTSPAGSHDPALPANSTEPSTEPSKMRKLLKRVKPELDFPTLTFMLRGSLPSAITLAMYQSTVIAHRYTTFGYVIPIIALFSLAPLPRAKYLQNLLLNSITSCIAAAFCLLGLWCGIKARDSNMSETQPQVEHDPTGYNSSQAAVCAIFLFVWIYAANACRCKVPSLQNPVFMASVLAMILLTYGPRFPTMDAVEATVKELLEVWFIAFGVATGVNLLIFPVGCRRVLFKQVGGFLGTAKKVVGGQRAYFRSLGNLKNVRSAGANMVGSKEASALRGAVHGLKMQFGAIRDDATFAKREIAWGKLSSGDIRETVRLLRETMVPAIGISTIVELFDTMGHRVPRQQVNDGESVSDAFGAEIDEKGMQQEEKTWEKVSMLLQGPFASLAEIMDQGLQHALIVLEIAPKPKKKRGSKKQGGQGMDGDVEKSGGLIHPGETGFADGMDHRLQSFQQECKGCRDEWIQMMNDCRDRDGVVALNAAQRRRDHEQLYGMLYMEQLLYDMAKAIFELVLFADMKVRDGTMKRPRFINPSLKQVWKWIRLTGEEDHANNESMIGSERNPQVQGGLYAQKKDPEHQIPQNFYEKYTNHLRAIPRFLKSPESVFGFRVACATMSAGILAFLHQTWVWYYEQRIIWTMIVIIIGWSMTTGQSVLRMLMRFVACVAAVGISLAAWYMVDLHIAGILVMLWLSFFLIFYIFNKYPKFISPCLLCITTVIAIVGNELQKRKLGIAPYEETGQAIYPIYELAAYRLVCVIVGISIAYFWAIFPYPLTERSLMRTELGSGLFLLARFYCCGQATIDARLRGAEGDPDDKKGPGQQLAKLQHKILAQFLCLLPNLRSRLSLQKFDFPIGGRFAVERYESILTSIVSLLDYLVTMYHATRSCEHLLPQGRYTDRQNWDKDISDLVRRLDERSQEVAATLTLLSAAIEHGLPLPPYFNAPAPFIFGKLWQHLSQDLHDRSEHAQDSAHSAFAVIQVMSNLVSSELGKMIDNMVELVGEVDFDMARFKELEPTKVDIKND